MIGNAKDRNSPAMIKNDNAEPGLDARIDSIPQGGSLQISECNGVRVVAERSGDGKTLRFIRYKGDTWEVFRTCPF